MNKLDVVDLSESRELFIYISDDENEDEDLKITTEKRTARKSTAKLWAAAHTVEHLRIATWKLEDKTEGKFLIVHYMIRMGFI